MDLDEPQIEDLEHELGAFDIRVDGVAIWERIRTSVYRAIHRQHGAGQSHTVSGMTVPNYLRGGFMLARNLFYRNPFLADSAEVMFVGHQRRKREADGLWWDIYCDPVHEASSYDYVHFEKPHLLGHLRPAKTDRLRWLDLIEYSGTIQKILGVNSPEIPADVERSLRVIQEEITARFDAEVGLVQMVRSELNERTATLPLYRRLLRKVDPACLVLVCSYGKETLIEAAHELSIQVVELQHGVIHPQHLGYHYPEAYPKQMFPDYVLTWGEFWSQNARFPLPDERVIAVGYPYLDERIDQFEHVPQRDQLLFISQGSVGERLSRFALDCAADARITSDIVFKLHPGEVDRWRGAYPWLLDSEVTVIDGQTPTLYELFAESHAQVGVGSTAIYEGLCFDLETYVYDINGASTLLPLFDAGAAEVIDSVDALAAQLGRGADTFDREHYFAAGARSTMQETLERLITSGTVHEQSR